MVHNYIKIGSKTIKNRTIPNLNLKQDFESHGEILEKVNGCNFEQLPRNGPRKVALKQLHNSQNICPQFLNELESSFYCNSNKTVHIYGITQEPKTKDYMIVMQLVEQGNLRTYIRENYNKLTWIKRIEILLDIARGLHSIHQAGLCHKNIHTGNLLYDNGSVLISDLGLLGPANKPRIKIEIPKCFEKLMLQCWDDDEFNRPNTRQLVDNLSEWYNEIRNNTHSEFMTADEQKHLQLKLPLYKYDVYKSQRVRTTDFGDDDGIKFSGNDYNGYGNDFPSLIARESDSSLEDEEDLEEYEYVSMQRNDLLSWLENVEDGMPNLLDCKY
ncbi:12974_t:CDS:2 [Dentiscutata erythropus]|uniref:12974_t:CDS:1 n=1 Tax=Dentiscutata erythropus TaxID=1348616 RepID=A0A9N8WDK4_9GLOM|nr:12974_t:CDS:2 [Dentiscutata erythropus]